MGNPSFITEDAIVAAENPSTGSTTAVTITNPVTPPPSLGVTALTSTAVESSTGTTAVTFVVSLTQAVATDTVVDYTAAPNVDYPSGADPSGKVFFSASDFGGAFPTGSVTIAAGQTQADFTINVPNSALLGTTNKWLGVSITPAGDNPLYGPSAQVDVLNNHPIAGPPAQPAIALASSATLIPTEYQPTLIKSGNAYTLNLGNILDNITLQPLSFSLANMAAPGADNLSSGLANVIGAGFQLSGNLPSKIAGGNAGQFSLVPETSGLGAQSETLTISSDDVNDTGYSATLPNMTLTITDNVLAAAAATVGTSSVTFAKVRVGARETQAVTIKNSGELGAADLDVTTTAGAGTTASGAITQLAASASDSSDIVVGLDTSTAGLKSGTVTLNAFSDLGNGVEIPALPSPTISVSGAVYREAQGEVAPSQAIVHVGDPSTQALLVTNADAADGYSEGLRASLISSSGGVAVSGGPTGLIAAGGSEFDHPNRHLLDGRGRNRNG